MSSKSTEWKKINLTQDPLDFTGTTSSELEVADGSFISLKLKLKSGRVVRIRKNDYSINIEEPVIPVQMKYLARTTTGLERLFDKEEDAQTAISGVDGEVKQVAVPLNNELNSLPF